MDTEISRDTSGAQPLHPFFSIVDGIPGVMPPYVIQVDGGRLSEDELEQLRDLAAGRIDAVVFEAIPGRHIKTIPFYPTPPEIENLSAFGGPWCDVEAQRLTYYRVERGKTRSSVQGLIDQYKPRTAVHVVSDLAPADPFEQRLPDTALYTIKPGQGIVGMRVDLAIIDAAAITTEKRRDWLNAMVLGRLTPTGRVVALIEVDPTPPDLAPAA